MLSILVPTDFSPCAQNALDYAVSFAQKMNAKLTVINAFSSFNLTSDERETALAFAQDKLATITAAMKSSHPNIACESMIENGLAEDVIIACADSAEYNLIIMGTHGESLVMSFDGNPYGVTTALGSVTSSITGSINIPMIAIPADGVYNDIDTIVLLSDFQSMPSHDSYDFIKKLALNFDAKINVLHIESKSSKLSDAFTEMSDFEKIFAALEHEYIVIKSSDVELAVSNMELADDELISIICKQSSAHETIFDLSLSKKLVGNMNKILLILPEYILATD